MTSAPAGPVRLASGESLHVEDEGAGPAIVFVHGLPGLGGDFQPLVERLRAGFRCVSYDRTGYGGSAPAHPSAALGVVAQARQLLRLLDALDVEDAHLAGWSYGGVVAMEAARLAPDRIAGLVLLGSPGPAFAWPRGASNRLLFSTPLGGPLLRLLLALAPSALGRPLDQAYGEPAPEAVHRRFIAGLRRPGTVAYWMNEGRHFDPTACVPEEVARPALVIHGERDVQVPVAVGHDLARRLPHAELIVLEDAGHWPFATHADRVADAVRCFLAGNPAKHSTEAAALDAALKTGRR